MDIFYNAIFNNDLNSYKMDFSIGIIKNHKRARIFKNLSHSIRGLKGL